MQVNHVIVKPVITEKTSRLTKENVYAFQVHMNADKNQIAQAIKTFYGVEINNVRIFTRKGKEKRVGRTGKTKKLPDIKVAYIRVSKGSIDLFPKA